jgi:hypothetical protein
MTYKTKPAAQPRVQLDPALFQIMPEQMDVEAMTRHSSINHHVDGMDYLCLSRSEALTVKLYLMEEPRNDNSGFLVNPHSHRYAFSSIVLAGALAHLRFMPSVATYASEWERFEYHAETRELKRIAPAWLHREAEICPAGARYFVEPHEIHTLCVDSAGPLLLGLVQFADQGTTSDLYLPVGSNGKMTLPGTRKPTIAELSSLRDRAIELMRASATFDTRTQYFERTAKGIENLKRESAGAQATVRELLEAAVKAESHQ